MDNVRIVRLTSGEDVIAFFEEDEGCVLLGNPMTVMFKRMPTGKALMMMSPWLPMEIIEEDIVSVPHSQIITIMHPKKHMVEYFTNTVFDMDNELDNREDDDLSLRDASQTQEELYDEEDEELQSILESFGSDSDGSKRTIH